MMLLSFLGKKKKKVISSQLNQVYIPQSSIFKVSNVLKLSYFYREIMLSMSGQQNWYFFFFFLIRLLGAAQIHSLRFITEEQSSEFCAIYERQCGLHVDKYVTCKGSLQQEDISLFHNLYKVSIPYRTCMIIMQLL